MRSLEHRDLVEDHAEKEAGGGYTSGRRRTGVRLTFRGGVPQSVWGRVGVACALIAIVGVIWIAATTVRHVVLRDERFVIAGSSSILIEGNHHLSRAELLDVLSSDIERNILRISLNERKAEVERLPWVRHATIMRLLPDRIRVSVEERTPVAFVRHGGRIDLVDASGVLLKMGPTREDQATYSFPVVTGIVPEDPASVRAARMRLFQDFMRDLDSTGERISARLSEIDLSNPEDIKALIPGEGKDILVHFGDSDFLARYKKFEAHLPEWRALYPKLSSTDMRYERQVVLEMQPGTTVPLATSGPESSVPTKSSESAVPREVGHAGAPKSPAKVVPLHHQQSSSHPLVHAVVHSGMEAGHR